MKPGHEHFQKSLTRPAHHRVGLKQENAWQISTFPLNLHLKPLVRAIRQVHAWK